MGFSENRAYHSRGVALLMQRLAPLMGLPADRMLLVGWLHDLGYALGDSERHAETMGRLLAAEGFEYADVVRRHGTNDIDYDNPADILLNVADMSINGQGRLVSFDQRISDVAERWGENHPRVGQCRRVCDRLEASEYWPRLAETIVSMPEYGTTRQLADCYSTFALSRFMIRRAFAFTVVSGCCWAEGRTVDRT